MCRTGCQDWKYSGASAGRGVELVLFVHKLKILPVTVKTCTYLIRDWQKLRVCRNSVGRDAAISVLRGTITGVLMRVDFD